MINDMYVSLKTPTNLARCGDPDERLPMCRIAILLLAAALLAGCASQSSRQAERNALHSRAPALNEQLFGKPASVPDFSEMVALTPAQKADFMRFFGSGVNSRQEPHRR